MNTLQYAQRATNIKRKIFRNVKEDEETPTEKCKQFMKYMQTAYDQIQNILRQPIVCSHCKAPCKQN